jgi:O-antigen/teichoic acid export membrane protein
MTGWSAILITGYILNFMLARWFQLGIVGDYGTVMTVLLWIEIFVITGLPIAVQKHVSAREGDAYGILWAAMRLQFALVTGLTIALILAAPLFAAAFRDPRLTFYFRLAFLNLPFYGFFHLLVSFHNGQRRFGKQAVCYVFYGSAKLGFVLLACGFHRTLGAAFAGNILGSAFGLALAYALLDDRKVHPPALNRELIRFALPSLFYSLMIQLLMSVDLWSVRFFLGDEASGAYFMAATLSRIPYYLLAGLSAVMLPTISLGLSAGALEWVRDTIRNAVRFSMMLLIPVSVLLAVYSREILRTLFNVRYVVAGPALELLVWAMAALALMTLFLTLINADGRPKTSFLIAGLSVVLDLVLNALLVPKMGIAGAALAALVSVSAGAIWGAFNVLKKFHAVPTARSALNLGLASAGLLGCTLAIRTGGFGFVGIGLFGTAVFGLVLLISGEIRREDMVILSVKTKADGGVPAPPDSI